MSDYAVFFDPTHKRWWWIKRISTVLGLISVIIVSIFLLSILSAPLLPDMPGITSVIKKTLRTSLHLPRHQTTLRQYQLRRDREKLFAEIAKEQKQKSIQKAQTAHKGSGIVAAFYAPWQETGLHSLRAYAPRMTHLMPAWVHLTADGGGLDLHDWDPHLTPHNEDVLKVARDYNLTILPVFSNAQLSDFDSVRVHRLLTTPELQDRVVRDLRNWIVANRFQGINIDFENLAPGDEKLMIPFLERLHAIFAPNHLQVTIDLEAAAPIDWKRAAAICDFVVVMAYDEHSSSTPPGPIASMAWYRSVLRRATRPASYIPPEKLVIGLANYAYDWTEGEKEAEPLTYQEALVRAHDYRPGEPVEKIIDFDPNSLNPNFWYVDEAGKDHEVWMLDAITVANQWLVAQNYSPRGVGIWVLGSSDPSIWTFLGRNTLNMSPNPGVLREVSFPYDVEFVGEGEILHVRAGPTAGSRSLEVDPTTGLIQDEVYHKFPTSYVIDRSGYKPKQIALTIDDGPADPYSAQMLDDLKKYNVKATFFVIGQNAERYPSLVRRMWREGHEIGNHSYTHPNIGAIPESRARAEINATQRVIQSLIGRSTLLFRPPYNADAEPTSLEEVRPVSLASSQNYIVVGEYIDPQDWNTDERLPDGSHHHRTAEEMLQSTLAQLNVEKGSCILLHDGGGDREETVRLIPMLIEELSKRGYKFVTVSQLVGATRDQVNPRVRTNETFMLANDRIVFEAMYLGDLFLTVAFMSAIGLGAARMMFVTTLALIAKRREKRSRFDPSFKPSVSVVIAAFNEEKVIARTIDAVLASRYADLEVVVVDDGSHDDTSGEVRRHFGDRVHLLRQENGGKAAALNRGIAEARGDIIVALDADTLFRPDTIEKLVRRFENPQVGAVAGNVKVGNRINPLTYWQAIEYITSQNLDRRAYAGLNCVSVVPGAVGAWRRTAIVNAGGYTTDTMAEDMDLTWRIRRNGWLIDTDSDAIGFTEAPDTFRNLFKQRFRWAFGTLQSLWKHRSALGRYGWFGRVMLPSLWLFQVVYQALSPVVDLQIVWTLGTVAQAILRGRLTHDWQPLPAAMNSLYLIGFMYAFFFVVELIGSLVAFKLDREDGRMLLWLFWQRFLYRQLMYAVLLKSIKTAISGMRAGWGKLERKGTVEVFPVTGDQLPG